MTLPTYMPDHVGQALSKLTTPFQNRPRFAAWCRSQVNRLQELEDMFRVFLESFDVDTCDLARLRIIGKIVGQEQRGTLEQFRRLVKVRILVNRSNTTAPALIKIAQILLSPLGSPLGLVKYRDGDCSIEIEGIAGVSDLDAATTIEFLRAAKMGGVGLRLIASTHDDGLLTGTVAGAIASRTTTPDAVHGFSNTALSDGGYAAQNR